MQHACPVLCNESYYMYNLSRPPPLRKPGTEGRAAEIGDPLLVPHLHFLTTIRAERRSSIPRCQGHEIKTSGSRSSCPAHIACFVAYSHPWHQHESDEFRLQSAASLRGVCLTCEHSNCGFLSQSFADQWPVPGTLFFQCAFRVTLFIDQFHLHLPPHRLHIGRHDTLRTRGLYDD